MVDYCIDTSIIVEFLRGNEAIENKINTIIHNGLNIFTTYITLCELYKGAYSFYNSEKEIKDLEEFTDNFELLNFEKEACKEFGKQYDKLKKIEKKIELKLKNQDYSKEEKLLLSQNDIVYISLAKGTEVIDGDKFTIFTITGEIKHPVTEKPAGFLI